MEILWGDEDDDDDDDEILFFRRGFSRVVKKGTINFGGKLGLVTESTSFTISSNTINVVAMATTRISDFRRQNRSFFIRSLRLRLDTSQASISTGKDVRNLPSSRRRTSVFLINQTFFFS